jgi:ubiquinone/menaquinone biosynthesis C-methylase UbiE
LWLWRHAVPEPAAALREMQRVLRPGGRAALSAWDAAGVVFTLYQMT